MFVALSGQTDWNKERAAITKATSLWQGSNVDSYNYTQQVMCHCPPALLDPINVTVIRGEIASAVDGITGSPADRQWVTTVDDLLGLIQLTLDQATNNPPNELIAVEYDSVLGYPTSYTHDIGFICDTRREITFSGFTPLSS